MREKCRLLLLLLGLGAALWGLKRLVCRFQVAKKREECLREETERMQQFIDAMTHEMNTPLTSILGYAQFLQQANGTDGQKRMAVEKVEAEARRLREMHQKLMRLYLLRTDGIRLERVGMMEIMAGVREELGYLLEEKEMELREYCQPQEFYSDRTLLHILLSNLIRNSINYSPRGGQIYVVLQRISREELKLEVRDWGQGIPKESLSRVTEPFYRVDKSRSRQTGGCGIGLYLCRQIAEKLKGRMQIDSREGEGTKVTVYFPAVEMVDKK